MALATAPGPPVTVRQLQAASSVPSNTVKEPFLLGSVYGAPPPTQPTYSPPPVQSAFLENWEQVEPQRRFENDVHDKELELERKKEQERLVSGVENLDLNALLRAFDKQVQHVHLCPPPYDDHIPRGLNLQPDPAEEFTLDKLRNSLERFYASVVVGLLRTVYEVNRIRRWDETSRTVIAMIIYSYSWYCDLIITTLLLFLSILVLVPSSRDFFFAPPIMMPQHPYNEDDVEKLAESRAAFPWGPAASETNASEWAQSVQDVMTSLSAGEGGNEQIDSMESTVAGDVDSHLGADMKKREEAGNTLPGDERMSRKDKAIRMYAQPGMRIISGFSDKWERVANALNPQPSYALEQRRVYVFLHLLLPVILISTFVTERMISKAIGLAFGLCMFGKPLISHVLDELDRINPEWKEKLILEYNMLDTVPTNSQLILRLLRNAEHQNHPLPPAPNVEDTDDGSDDTRVGSDEDDDETDDEPEESKKSKVFHKGTKVATKVRAGARAKARRAWDKLGKAKEEGFALVTGHRKVDYGGKAEHALEKMHLSDSTPAQALLYKMPSAPKAKYPESASRFYVWHEKHGPGHIIIHPREIGTPARIEFTTVRRVPAIQNASIQPDEDPSQGHLVVLADDVAALKKVDMNIVGRAALNLALDVSRAGGTGLEITVVRRNVARAVQDAVGPTVAQGKEEIIRLKGIVRRNELFDRLLALGDQRWEML